MKPWAKWQDWSTLVVGAVLFLTPFVIGAAANTVQCTLGSTTWFLAVSSWDAWIVGVALVAASLWALARPGAGMTEWVRIVLGVWLFFVLWILGFEASGAAAWIAWSAGILVIALAGWRLLASRNVQTPTKVPSF